MTTLQQVYMNQLQKEVTINENFYAVAVAGTFSNRGNHQGLDFNYYGGRYQKADGSQDILPDGSLTLDDNHNCYVYFDLVNEVMAFSISNVPNGAFPIALVTTSSGKITAIEDIRVMPLYAVGTPANLIYVLPIATDTTLGGVKVDEQTLTIDTNGVLSLKLLKYLDFDTTTTDPNAVARLVWNDTDGTLNLGLKGGNVVLQIGQEQVQYAYNNSGVAITDGEVVYVTGASADRLTVAKAIATGEPTSSKTFGIATEPLTTNGYGFITTSGLVRGLNTNAFNEGDALWLSATTAGGLTNIRPTAPNHSVLIGWVIRKSLLDGSIYVNVANGYELDELHNVLLTSLVDGQPLVYETSTGLWKNKNLNINNVDGFSLASDTFANASGQKTTSTTEHFSFKLSHVAPKEATSNIEGFRTLFSGQANTVAYTTTNVSHYRAQSYTLGTNQTVTNNIGFHAGATLTAGVNNYGFYSNISSANNRWNFYANGTAPNYFAGDLRTNSTILKNVSASNSDISATAASSSLVAGIRTGTPATNITLTLPTGTNMDAVFQNLQVGQGFDWSYINLATATFTATMLANTAHTVVGDMVVQPNSSARFTTTKTATNTFITYRIA